jgi:dipeptidyl aminopeptidase/acylaminoacyl peptidase
MRTFGATLALIAATGLPARLVLHPRQGHDVAGSRHVLCRIRRVVGWFEAHDRDAGGSP